jgi:hypothetical protein
MPVFLPIIVAASHLVLVADQLPKFDIESGCQITAAAAEPPKRDSNICKREELTARGKLNDEWGSYTPGQKSRCVSFEQLGGNPSYVELLTCLELAKAARNLPPSDRTTGQGWSD